MTGEIEDRNFIVTRGDTRVALTIGRNKHTARFNRQNRFLIDDPDSTTKMSFTITKPLRIGNTYNNEGILKFVLSESNTTDYDNFDLLIADYYLHFNSENEQGGDDIDDTETPPSSAKEVWI